MHKSYFGAGRQELFGWLTRGWFTEGPVACFVEGFPGVGKSDLAAALSTHVESTRGWTSIYVEVPDQAAPSFNDVLLEVAELLESRGKTEMLAAMAQANPNPAYALERALRDDVLIVIDEAGRLLGSDGNATAELSGVFSYLRNRLSLRGRVLLLSDVAIERNRWSEVFPIKALPSPSIAEAVELLTDRLATSGHPDAVPAERKADLVRILGQNPRAIETLVATLTFESLDEVIGHEPGLWEVNDRAISREFLEALERRLLERTLSHLQPLQLKRLSMLAVHRKSFESAAFEAVTSGARKEWRDLRHNLVSRFLISLRLQWHALNPLVREISLSRLRENTAEFKTAHSLAADHHMRHFRAKTIVLDHQNLTGSYAELRYHLFNAGRTQELRDVALRLCDHFTSTWNAVSPVPQDRAELDERIGVLSALLQEGGPKSLEYYLARCLKTRGSAKDLQQAVVHVSRATDGKAPAAAWLLRAQLHSDLGDSESSIQACIDAVRVVDPADAIGTLYGFGARVLAQQGKVDDAVAFLRAGILLVPPSKNLFTLYQSAAELLGQAGKTDAAVELLKEGIKVIPADKSLFSLYQSAAELLAKCGKIEEAVVQLRAGIKSASRSGGLVFHLYQSAAELLQRFDRRAEAITLLRECIREVPGTRNSLSIFKLAALLLAKQGKHDEAIEVLEQGSAGIASSLHQRDIYYRTKAELMARAGRPADAQACLEEGVAALKPDENRFALFQLSAALLRQAGDVDGALRRLQEGIDTTPYAIGGGKLLEALCQLAYIAERRDVLSAIAAGTVPTIQRWMATVLLAQLDFDWRQAASTAKAARAAFPTHAWFATTEAFALLAQGEAQSAHAALNSFKNLDLPVGSAVTWLRCLAATFAGDIGRARVSLVRYLRFGKGAETNPSRSTLLVLWNSEMDFTEPHPAYVFPVLPSAITGLAAPVRRGPQGEVSELISSATVEDTGSPTSPLEREGLNAGITAPALDSVLLMATEWRSVHGGLSTFNRQLCRTLASQGHMVVCAVPSATPEEVGEAQQNGVRLVVATALAGSEPLSGLYRPLPLPAGFVPNVVIGHGRITGAAAKAQSTDHFRTARRVHFVHMAPGEIEWFKEGENPAALGEARERIEGDLAADADLVAAVGPRLRREFSDLLRGIGAQTAIHEFVPGPAPANPNLPPQLNHCLVLGRVDDYELKGLDIAARALGLVVASRRFAGTPPELIVRGAKRGTAADLRRRLQLECPGIDLAVRVREYDSSEETIESDLRRAALLLMPSRREGFGLVALEALSKGVPVLVSDTSGFGEVLQRTAPEVLVRNAVVTTPQEVDAAARNWADAVAMQLLDPVASFARATELGRHLAQTHGWDAAVRSLMERLSRL